MSITRGLATINGTNMTAANTQSVNQDNNFLIGNVTNGSSTPFSTGFIGQWKWAKLYSNDVLIRDFIPAKDQNGVGFMFDKVSHTIYDNAGTGSFDYGQAIH